MKVIDLINKMAKGEVVPKKIKFDNKIYNYNEKTKNYRTIDEDENVFLLDEYHLIYMLNEEVEIIEEPKKIEKIDLKEIEKNIKSNVKNDTYFACIINEIIDYINKEE